MHVSRRRFLKFSIFAIVAHLGIAWFEERSGVRAMRGGVHPGRGTRNALISFGSRRYLEIIAPDPAQPAVTNVMVDRLRALPEPRLVGWAEHTSDLNAVLQKASAAGIGTDLPWDGSRARPDGKVLRWRSFNLKEDFGALLPFFIQWNAESVHPSEDAPGGLSLQHFFIESPHARDISEMASKLGLDVEVQAGKTPGLKARITGKKDVFELG